MSGRDVVRLGLLSAPRQPIVTKHAHRTSGVPLRVNCSCATRKQLRGPLLSVRECVAVYRFGIGYSHPDLRRTGPIQPVLMRIDPLLAVPIQLSSDEFENLVAFVRDGLLDERVNRQNLCKLVPDAVPSGMTTIRFQECPQ